MSFELDSLNFLTEAGDPNKKCERKKANNRVIINVGGTKHECYISTIQNLPDSRLHWIAETALKTSDFDPDVHEFFFDRHPGCFVHIMNFFRTGQLHFPNDVCGPLFEQELAFWGIDEQFMEPCCWSNYTQHREAQEHLKIFDAFVNEPSVPSHEEKALSKKYRYASPWKWYILSKRLKVWCLMENTFTSFYSQIIALISIAVIILSITTFCLSTMEYFRDQRWIFAILERVYCCFFTIEFLIRLACCPFYKKFFKSPQTYIDIISTLQFYINFLSKTVSVDFLLAFRLFRMFRLFRFFKKLSGMQVIAQTLKASLNELMLLVLIFLIPMVIFSTLLYYSERAFANNDLKSIPENFWWAIVTMTTVGYGDMVPQSGLGKLVGAMCACCGVLIVALPVSVVGRNFTLFYSYAQARIRLPQKKKAPLIAADKMLVDKHRDGFSAAESNSNELWNEKDTSAENTVIKPMAELSSLMLHLALPQLNKTVFSPRLRNERRNAFSPRT